MRNAGLTAITPPSRHFALCARVRRNLINNFMTLEIPQNFEKSDQELLKQECLQKFIEFRHEMIDDLPQQKLKPSDENYYKYKCRGNAFVAIQVDIANLIDEGILVDPVAVEKGRAYMEYVKNRDFSKFSTQVDVSRLNEILDVMISELS
jgi:hypothetical protein